MIRYILHLEDKGDIVRFTGIVYLLQEEVRRGSGLKGGKGSCKIHYGNF